MILETTLKSEAKDSGQDIIIVSKLYLCKVRYENASPDISIITDMKLVKRIFLLTALSSILLCCSNVNSEHLMLDTWREMLIVNPYVSCNINAQIKAIDGDHFQYTIEPVYFDQKQFDIILEQFCGRTLPSGTTGYHSSIVDDKDTEIEIEFFPDYIYLQRGDPGIIQLEDWIIAGDAYPGEPAGTTLNNIHITKEAAIQNANEFLMAVDIKEFELANCEKCRILTNSYQTVCEGWYLTYSRHYPNYYPLDYTTVTLYGDMNLNYSNYTAPFYQERIMFVVTEEGCQVFQWNTPVKIISSELCEDQMLSLSQIQRIMKLEIQNGYSWCDSSFEECDYPMLIELRLTWGMIETIDNTAKIVPMWVAVFTSDYYSKSFLRPFVVCINAITGENVK